jgi:hypothetical protein
MISDFEAFNRSKQARYFQRDGSQWIYEVLCGVRHYVANSPQSGSLRFPCYSSGTEPIAEPELINP